MRSPYHHSVWFDVAGVVGLIALLLAPLGYLASTLEGVGGGGSSIIQTGPAQSAPVPTGGLTSTERASRIAGARTPLFGDGGSTRPSSTGEAPFSADWRSTATPDLGGASASGGSKSGTVSGGRSGGNADRSGPALADRRG